MKLLFVDINVLFFAVLLAVVVVVGFVVIQKKGYHGNVTFTLLSIHNADTKHLC